MQEDVNSTKIQNFRIIIENGSQSIDYKTEFPNEFNVDFKEYDQEFKVKFAKEAKVSSNDIYVIDQSTGQPIKYDSRDHEVTNLNLKCSLFPKNPIYTINIAKI